MVIKKKKMFSDRGNDLTLHCALLQSQDFMTNKTAQIFCEGLFMAFQFGYQFLCTVPLFSSKPMLESLKIY